MDDECQALFCEATHSGLGRIWLAGLLVGWLAGRLSHQMDDECQALFCEATCFKPIANPLELSFSSKTFIDYIINPNLLISSIDGKTVIINWPTGANQLFLGYCLQR